MSYDIDIVDPVTKGVLRLDFPHHLMGGTFALGGTREERVAAAKARPVPARASRPLPPLSPKAQMLLAALAAASVEPVR